MELLRRRLSAWVVSLLAVAVAAADDCSSVHDKAHATGPPPFAGTLFIHADIITDTDPTTFESISYAGRGGRTMFDRRKDAWIRAHPYLFEARYQDGLHIEVQVNPEFESRDRAQAEALKYARMIGQLPTLLRVNVETVWIHRGNNSLGGGNNNLLIHTGDAEGLARDGLLEEGFIHEASHTSLDAGRARAADWCAAQARDARFISTYARDHPEREDVAESFPTYLAVRHRADRLPRSLLDTILKTIPNRIEYFDDQPFSGMWCPIKLADCRTEPNAMNPAVRPVPQNRAVSGESRDLKQYDLALLPGLKSEGAGIVTEIIFVNRTQSDISYYWVDYEGAERFYGVVRPNDTVTQSTYGGHVWVVKDVNGDALAVFGAGRTTGRAVIGTNP